MITQGRSLSEGGPWMFILFLGSPVGGRDGQACEGSAKFGEGRAM